MTASILYAWEFGANLGHVGRFLPVAECLRGHGAEVCWAVAEPERVAQLQPEAGFEWRQAPLLAPPQQARRPVNYADILLGFGYDDPRRLHDAVSAWRELMRQKGTRLLLADHAPTALLAARTMDLPAMLFGGGFFVPPQQDPTPNMRPWLPLPAAELRALDARALASINEVLSHHGRAPLSRLAALFQVAEDALLTFPELDHYAQRGPARYWGLLQASVGGDCPWPGAGGPKVFAYLRPETANLEFILSLLQGTQASVVVYAPGLDSAVVARHAASHIAFVDRPVNLVAAAAQAHAAITYASPATTVAFLLAGKPVLMLPGHLEQFLFSLRVAELGAGLLQNPEEPGDALPDLLHRVLNDSRLRANAEAFGRKYAGFDQAAVTRNVVARILDLARID